MPLLPHCDAVIERADDVCLLLHAESGEYFALSPSAEWAWQLLCQQTPLEQIAERMAMQFQVDAATASRDLQALTRELLNRRLLVET